MKPNKDEIAIAFKTMDGEDYEGTVEIKYSMCDLFKAYDQKILTFRMLGVLGACYFYRYPERQDEDVKHHLNQLHKSDQFTIMHFAAYCSGRYRRNPGEPDVEPHDTTKPQEAPEKAPESAPVGKPQPAQEESVPVTVGKPQGKPRPPQEFKAEVSAEQLGVSKETADHYLEVLTEEIKAQQKDPTGKRYQNEPLKEEDVTASRPRQAPTPPMIAAKQNGKPRRKRQKAPVRPPDPTKLTPLIGKPLKEVEIELNDEKPGHSFVEKLTAFDQG